MTGRVGEISDGELWLRCPECGDSQNDPTKAHFSISLSNFTYYCLRCGYSGQLGPKEILDLMARPGLDITEGIQSWEDQQKKKQCDGINTNSDIDCPPYLPGAGSPRPSLLSRFHYQGNLLWDVFEMRHPKDYDVIGVQFRCGKRRVNFGELGYGWVGSSLRSSPENPLFLVEGPYDVIEQNYVSVFGLITKGKLIPLIGHSVVLVPDGDVWQKPELLKNFIHVVEWIMNNRKIYFQGIIHLQYEKDPDEAKKEEQVFVPREKCWTYLKEYVTFYLAINTKER